MSRRRRTRHIPAIRMVAIAALIAVVAIVTVRDQAAAERWETDLAVFAANHVEPEVPMGATTEGEDPDEAEKIDAALLEQGYFIEKIPLNFDLQDSARTESDHWGVPYALTLAVMECESQFDSEAVGDVGEIGLMQLNPGPGGKYHASLQETTGMDPATPAGNIAGGCYLMGKYLAEYGDTAKALMAYNAGPGGAAEQWAAGITSTGYTDKVMAAMARWAEIVTKGS